MCYDIDGFLYMSDGLWTYILSGHGNIRYFSVLMFVRDEYIHVRTGISPRTLSICVFLEQSSHCHYNDLHRKSEQPRETVTN